jgi:membrane complex biogenesis BtpA family protein
MFNRKCALIAVVHVLPLPGAADYSGNMQEILRFAVRDAIAYRENGVDALLIENMHDRPYLKGQVEPETTAAMTVVAQSLKQETRLPIGIQILAGANLAALGVAVAADLDFLRVEGYVFAHVADEGIIESSAAHLLRRRANLQAGKIKVFADIKKKHSAHAITSDITLVETAQAAEFFKVDGVIVSGAATGFAPSPEEVRAVKAGTKVPVLTGSGVTIDNVDSFAPHSDAVIVGSSLKEDGKWFNHVDPARVCAIVKRIDHLLSAPR